MSVKNLIFYFYYTGKLCQQKVNFDRIRSQNCELLCFSWSDRWGELYPWVKEPSAFPSLKKLLLLSLYSYHLMEPAINCASHSIWMSVTSIGRLNELRRDRSLSKCEYLFPGLSVLYLTNLSANLGGNSLRGNCLIQQSFYFMRV